MKTKITNIDLSFHCHENWDAIKQSEKEKLCERCNHQVHDFREMNADEFAAVIKESPVPVCGRFNTSQLSSKMRYVVASIVAASMVPAACAPNEVVPPPSVEPSEEGVVIEHYQTLGIVFSPGDSSNAVLYKQDYEDKTDSIVDEFTWDKFDSVEINDNTPED